MVDQREYWNNRREAPKNDRYNGELSSFAKVAVPYFPTNAEVIELGCGYANDSAGFARLGFNVLATDFSEAAITNASEHFQGLPHINFEVLDISKLMPYKDARFDVVYARLSLHYFTDEVTKKVFKEIKRVLRPNGLLAFVCKTTDDPLYGQGELLEKDMFNLNGHIRHFFSEEYVRECLKGDYTIELMTSGKERFGKEESAFVNVIARAQAI